jgi:hypothetical protein
MNPNNDLNTRWNGLNSLASRVETLKRVGLKQFLGTIKSDNDKWIVISTLSQYMKKANDFND